MNVENINANLLVALDALLSERSVTRAARRLGLTQPATSNALARLRELFDDELLIRVGRTMEPTAMALRLAEPIQLGVTSFRNALAVTHKFDPHTSTLCVRIAANDFVQAQVLPTIMKRLAIDAPKVRVLLAHARHYADLGDLDEDTADLFLGFFGEIPTGYFGLPLFEEHLLAIVRKDHPKIGKELSLEDYLSLEHIVVSANPGSPGAVDTALAQRNLSRTVALHVPHFLQVPVLIAQTDFVAAVNSRSAHYFAPRLGLAIHPVPVEVQAATVGLIWHSRTHGDPGHAWFRAWLARIVGEPTGDRTRRKPTAF